MKISILRNGPNGSCIIIGRAAVADFATRWPCFGEPADLYASFDGRGDLVDLEGDEGMDGAGVAAIIADAQAALAAL